ncbi:MAG: family 16 glycosylhydrolase [Bacteroidota bacterium]
MKRFKFFILSLALILFFSACEKEESHDLLPAPEQSEEQQVESRNTNGWTLKWEDNFDFFNSSNWTKIDAPGGINGELSYIRPNNVWTSNGNLVIMTNNDGYGGRAYTSGKIISKNKKELKYGRVDVRMRAAITQGSHNAAWLLHKPCDGVNPCGSDWPPELDIMEVIGREPDRAHQTIHTSKVYRGGCEWNGSNCGSNYYQDGETTWLNPWPGNAFYTYSIEWEPTQVKWYINGSLKHTFTQNGVDRWVPDELMYIILDCTVGGSWAGSPDGSSSWPQYTYVDWIKVYEKSNGGGNNGGGNNGGNLSDGNYRIKNVASGHYLTADGSNTEWVTPYQASLGNNWGSQKWVKIDIGGGFFKLEPHWPTNRCLTANNNSGIQNVFQAAYQNWGTQKWKAVDVGNGQYRIEASWPSNATLTTPNNNNWSSIKQNSVQNNNQEKWIFESI